MKFRKKPVVIEAVKWIGENIDEVRMLDGERGISMNGNSLIIHTLEGQMEAKLGDWIIKGIVGEIYPCKPDIFEKTYEPVI